MTKRPKVPATTDAMQLQQKHRRLFGKAVRRATRIDRLRGKR